MKNDISLVHKVHVEIVHLIKWKSEILMMKNDITFVHKIPTEIVQLFE